VQQRLRWKDRITQATTNLTIFIFSDFICEAKINLLFPPT
jgi:hypothetical protein